VAFGLDDFRQRRVVVRVSQALNVDLLKIDGMFVSNIAPIRSICEWYGPINRIGQVWASATVAESVEQKAVAG